MDFSMVTFITILQLLTDVFLITVILLQSGKGASLSGAVGGSNSFFSKTKGKTWDEKLARMTQWVALAFAVLSLTLSLIH